MSSQPLSPSSQQAAQELSTAQLTPVTLAQGQTLQTSTNQTQGAAQHAYLPSNWNYRSYRKYLYQKLFIYLSYYINLYIYTENIMAALWFPPFAPISIWDPDDGYSSCSVCDSRGQHPCHCFRQQQSGQNGESDVPWKNYLASTYSFCFYIVFLFLIHCRHTMSSQRDRRSWMVSR